MAPGVCGQREQSREIVERLGRDGDVGRSGLHHIGQLQWIALLQRQMDSRIAALEYSHHPRQGIARLGMRGGNGESARIPVAEVVRRALQVVDLLQHALDDAEHHLPRFGDRGHALAAAHEDVEAELVLELADLLRHPRLRGMQGVGGLGQVEPAAHRLAYIAQVLEIHGLGLNTTLLYGYAYLFVLLITRVYYATGCIGKSRNRRPARAGRPAGRTQHMYLYDDID